MEPKDGGPAYPGPDDYSMDGRPIYDQHMNRGMSLRDHFAELAMQGLIAVDAQLSIQTQCEEAYRYADAMLRARENGA